MTKHNCIIVSVVYNEASWLQTKACCMATGYPVHYVERRPSGIGSLAEAINRGFYEANAQDYPYVWFVTNVTFQPQIVPRLLAVAKIAKAGVVHPSFSSDHAHLQTDFKKDIANAPFVEFTAAMVDTTVFANDQLDEDMPYWGHDLDYGYRMFKKGIPVVVDHKSVVGHRYIRHNKKPDWYTKQRKAARVLTDMPTMNALKKKYGDEWRDVMYSEKQITSIYSQVQNLMQ